MNAAITVTTAAEILAALAKNADERFEISGNVEISVDVAIGRPCFRIGGTAKLTLVARESSAPRVVAWGSSAPRVEARGYAQLRLWGKGIKAKLGVKVAVLLHSGATASGGKQTRVSITTAKDWCDYYGVRVERGVATVYKALNADFRSRYGTSYAPGEAPTAADWNGGKQECGRGLHFSPSPAMALEFHTSATKFAACRVALKDIAVHPQGDYPQKIKARGCCGPCYEVTRDGDPVGEAPSLIATRPTKKRPAKRAVRRAT